MFLNNDHTNKYFSDYGYIYISSSNYDLVEIHNTDQRNYYQCSRGIQSISYP